MPRHRHNVNAKSGGFLFTATSAVGGTGKSATTDWGPGAETDLKGNNEAHNNIQPSLSTNIIIKT